MTWLQAVVLGVVQGLTEFLPVSSSGHLALAQHVMRRLGHSGLPAPDSPGMIWFDLCAHLGTVAAIVLVFAPQWRRYLGSLWRELPEYRGLVGSKPPAALYVTMLAVVACVPTGVVGLCFEKQFEAAFARPGIIGAGLLLSGAVLFAAELRGRGRRGWRRFGVWSAAVVGLAQGVAVAPGISRSGATVGAALLCGLKRRWAGQFSFLIAVPAILGASTIKMVEVLKEGHGSDVGLGPVLAGSLVAAGVGYVALQVLLVAIQRAKLRYFGAYCWLIGGAAIVANLAGYL